MVSGGTVHSDLSSVTSYLSKVSSEISGLSGSWQGASYDGLSSKVEAFVSEATSGISGSMGAFASACDLYTEYQNTKQSLASAESSYNAAVSSNNSSSVTTYGNEIASLKAKLSSLKSQIESNLASASSFHMEASSNSGSSVSAALAGLGSPTFGSFEKYTFKTSNGLSIPYYLYIPNYNGQKVDGLPVILYMHGGGSNNSESSLLARGLSKALKEQTINPSGIAIIPFIQNFSDKRYVQGLKELTDSVVSEQNADKTRISVSGHSNGGIMTYKLIDAYPNYFAAAIPISGFYTVTDSFKNTKVWAFNGEYDKGSYTSNSGAAKAVEAIKALGGQAWLHTYAGAGHGYVQDYTYSNEYESPDGDVIAPLEWAYRQQLNTTNA